MARFLEYSEDPQESSSVNSRSILQKTQDHGGTDGHSCEIGVC